MVKNSKKSKETAIPESKTPIPSPAAGNGDRAAHSAEPVGAKRAAAKRVKPARNAKSTSKGQAEAVSTRKPRAGAERKDRAGKVTISEEQIRLRAYFIAERRMQHGTPGDSAHDWLEAQRQLQKEAKKRA
jgi:Protein of unknown function (DUF2934)